MYFNHSVARVGVLLNTHLSIPGLIMIHEARQNMLDLDNVLD